MVSSNKLKRTTTRKQRKNTARTPHFFVVAVDVCGDDGQTNKTNDFSQAFVGNHKIAIDRKAHACLSKWSDTTVYEFLTTNGNYKKEENTVHRTC